MRKVLVTGSAGFLGRNLLQALSENPEFEVFGYDTTSNEQDLRNALAAVDVVVHLAGVNRPVEVGEFEAGNAGFTDHLCDTLRELGRTPKILMSSSIQAAFENPYGISKRDAEVVLERFASEVDSEVVVFRFKNIFGKWSRPNYNSVVATFCHRATQGLPLRVDDPTRELDLVYVDDVVDSMLQELSSETYRAGFRFAAEMSGFRVTLGELADTITSFTTMRESCVLPELGSRLVSHLYSTYVSYLEGSDMAYGLDVKVDPRGSLAEFTKSSHGGQLFVSRTEPGVTRGNHYHHSKTEKFFVVQGNARIRLRHLQTDEIVEHVIAGTDYRVVDIPPGYTHSVENIGDDEMVVLFWASEMFDPSAPDTFFCEVSH